MAAKTTKPTHKIDVKKTPDAIPWPWNDRQTFWIFFGLITVGTGILFSKYLFGDQLFIFTDAGADPITIFYPNLVHAARYFQEVGLPGWSFYIGLGNNFYPGYVINPLNWVYMPMSPAAIAYTIGWVQALIIIGTGLLFYRFLKEAQFSPAVRVIGAVMYTFGGYLIIGSSWYGHSHAIFWMTFAIMGFEFLLRKKIWWLFVIPFIALLGTRSYFLILFMTIYAFVRMIDLHGSSWRDIWAGYKRMIICGVFAVMCALPFIGGQWHIFAYSPRVSGDVSYSDELSKRSVFHPSNPEHFLTALFRTYSNDGIGTGDSFKGWRNYLEAPAFYIGILMLFLVFQFFALAPKRQKIIYGSFLFFWVIMIIFPWFRYAFYGFAGNYYKSALSLFIPFSFLFVALKGLQEIISGKRISLAVLIGAFVFWLVLLWLPYAEPEVRIVQNVQLIVTIFLVLHFLLLTLLWAGVLKKFILPVLLLVVVAEGVTLSWPAINNRLTIGKADIVNEKFHFDDSNEAVRYIKGKDKDPFFRTDKLYGSVKSGFNDGMVQGFFGTKMYQSHNHKNYVRFMGEMDIINESFEGNTRWLIGLSANQFLHPLFSIKYLLINNTTQEEVEKAFYTKIHQAGDIGVFRNNFYIPFGIPFERIIDYDEFKTLNIESKRVALYRGVVVEDAIREKVRDIRTLSADGIGAAGKLTAEDLTSMASTAMKLESFNHKNIRGNIKVERPSVIFFSMPFDHGWKASVNGKEQELFLIDVGMTGLYLPAGQHRIELQYKPALATVGWIGVLGAALVAYLIHRNRKKFWQ
ncbi:MAG: YfhO family protein [Saprospiraceae bacterium]